jgi:hypothetical protein
MKKLPKTNAFWLMVFIRFLTTELKFWLEDLMGREHFGDLNVDEHLIL